MQRKNKKIHYDELFLLVEHNIFNIFQETIKNAGVDLTVTDEQGSTFLMVAAKSGHLRFVIFFLESGINLDAQDKLGNTALMYASYYNHNQCIEALVKAKANLKKHNELGASALHLAAINGPQSTINILINAKADIESLTKNKETPIMLAANACNNSAINALLNANANINHQDKSEKTALHYATLSPKANLETIKILLDAKADASKTDDKNKRAYQYVKNDIENLDMCNTLMSASTNVTIRNFFSKFGFTKNKSKPGIEEKKEETTYCFDNSVKTNIDGYHRLYKIKHS